MTLTDEIEVELSREDAQKSDPRGVGNDPHAVLCGPAGAEGDEMDLVDLEWRAEVSAAMDAYERGLGFA